MKKMKKMKKILFTTIIFCLSSCGFENNNQIEPVVEDDGIVLKYNLKEGDEFILDVVVDMNMKKENMTMKMEMTVATFVNEISINNVTNTSYNVDTEYTRLAVDMNIGNKSEKYDSDNPQSSDFSSSMHDMIGTMIDVKLNHEFTSTGKMITSPDYESLFTNPQIKMQMQGFNDQLESMIIKFPVDTLFIGSSWVDKIVADGITNKVEYTLKNITTKEYVFEINSVLNGEGMNGTQTGELLLDKNTCMITASNSTLKIPDIGMEANYKFTNKKIN